jgi:hypothetical protein
MRPVGAANAQYSRVLESVHPGVGLLSIGMQVYVESERARTAEVVRIIPSSFRLSEWQK